MPVWKCSQCGFEKGGPCRPKECPECNSPKDAFLKAEESKKETKSNKSAKTKPIKKNTKKK